MTVHLISAGLSVIDALRKPREKLRDPGFARVVGDARPAYLLADAGIREHQRDAAARWIAAALAPSGSADRDEDKARRLAQVTAEISPERWPDDFSAEIGTYLRMPGTRRPPSGEDIVVFVCSDTADGLLAGVWNALALTDGSLADVRYLSDPERQLRDARGRVVLARVPGMDVGDEPGFRQAMGALGVLARDLFRYGHLAPAEPFRFSVSGGYKAAIPYLIGLAEAVRSVDGPRLEQLGAGDLMPADGLPYPVEAWVLHEKAPEKADPIRLPLRRLVASSVRKELAGFGDDGKRREPGKPVPGTLEGYAYEAPGPRGKETCELTAFGVGLRALLGVPGEAW